MKSRTHLCFSLALAAAFTLANARTDARGACFAAFQQNVGKGPITAPRDAELEKQSAHSLEVAKFYFYKRKPDKNDKGAQDRLNKSVEDRLTEILDTNPTYARIDEVYFMLGEVYKRKGDTDKAVEYWEKAAKSESDQKIKSEAQKRLDEFKSKDKK